jgi:hypothetical protein
MNNLLPLMLREWLQHRFAWAMLVLVPLAVSLLLLSLGTIQLDDDMRAQMPRDLSVVLTLLTFVISTAAVLLLLGVTSLFIALNSPRRDHGDRSVEFWLSLPSGHAESLLAPILVHLLLVPAAALVVGSLVAIPVSMVTVGRVVGLGEWFALPWREILPALAALLLRAVAGVPMALLWLLPLVLAAMLSNAYFKRWGLPLLCIALILLSQGLERVFGEPVFANTLGAMLQMSAHSLLGAAGDDLATGPNVLPQETLKALPVWALRDFGAAFANLGRPLLAGVLVASAALFAALWAWRRRGAWAD